MRLVIIYSLISLLSISLNLVCQLVLLKILLPLYVSICLGTLIGLLVKYLLDARFIFIYKKPSVSNFVKYSFIGGAITPIWWVSEYAAYYFFNSNAAALVGGLVGLIFCYYLKYNLDKAYVFK